MIALALLRHRRRIARCTSGVALLEFALLLPIFLATMLTGAETLNYIITKMRVSQLALHVADNAARMGDGSPLQAKTVSETDVNDALTGAGLQGGELDLYNNGRVILSDLEPITTPNPFKKYFIRWQRCRGTVNHHSKYGDTATQPVPGVPLTTDWIDGIGPAGQQVKAQPDNATMFVEVFYHYTPLISADLIGGPTDFDEIASMAVRDRRDLVGGVNGLYNIEGAAKSTCDKYTAT